MASACSDSVYIRRGGHVGVIPGGGSGGIAERLFHAPPDAGTDAETHTCIASAANINAV